VFSNVVVVCLKDGRLLVGPPSTRELFALFASEAFESFGVSLAFQRGLAVCVAQASPISGSFITLLLASYWRALAYSLRPCVTLLLACLGEVARNIGLA
jgi:hypothetical protein